MATTLGFVGAGVMAEVMIDGLLKEGLCAPQDILASNRRAARSAELAERYGIRCTTDNAAVAQAADLLVLAVKPQTLGKVMPQLHGRVPAHAVVVSIIAGARTATLQKGLDHDAVVRCMPNLPCRIRKGMTVWAAPDCVSAADRDRVQKLLGVMGEALEVADEGHVDRATAVNGTGPAIVAEFVKAMLEAATYIGEPRSVARETVLSTIVGTAEMIRAAEQDGTHVAHLIDQVTSPGGTTSRALQVLKDGGFGATLTRAVDAAYQRTIELGAAVDD